jgi:hypothetical protein
MEDTRLSRLATQLLKWHAPGGDHVAREFADRADMVAALERAIARRSRRRRAGLLALVGAPVAAVITLVALGIVSSSRTEVTVREAGNTSPVRAGDRLRPKAPATMTIATGTVVAIAPASELGILELGRHQRLGLDRGRVRATVNKRRPDEEFVIVTPDALVAVRGTEFEVEVAADPACAWGKATRVSVDAGVVAVTHDGRERRLLPSETWTSPCLRTAETPDREPSPRRPATVASFSPKPKAAAPRRAPVPDAARARPSAPAQASTLTVQNQLFEQALAARRRGDHATAIGRLDELLARFPQGPLTEAAAKLRSELVKAAP